jgi:AraC-like DNA-binding protein
MQLRDVSGEHDVPAGHVAVFIFGETSVYGWPAPLPSDYRCTWVNLQGAGLAEHVIVMRRRYGSSFDAAGNLGLLEQLRRLQRMARPVTPTTPTEMAHATHGFFMRLMEHAHHRLFEAQSPVERAIEQILRAPTHPWSLKEVADRFGCSREHLSRIFRQRTGQTPAAHLNRARLQQALHLLRETTLPLAEVAEQTGFASTHTLARHVRRATGVPPTALRG